MYQPCLKPQILRTDSSLASSQYNASDCVIKDTNTQLQHREYKPDSVYIQSKERTGNNVISPSTPPPQRKPLKHYLCCICCPCLPMSARYGCCSLLLLFFIFLIIVGVLVAIFKMPVVDFNGPTRHPEGLEPFQKSNDSLAFSVNLGLKIAVINDNLESITFESIRTVAYYPTAPHVPVGGGELHNVNIIAYGISNFTFPFSIKYDPMKDEGFAMLQDIMKRCGLMGGPKEDLFINYDIIPTVRIAGIAISPTIHQSSHIPCPISSGQLSLGFPEAAEDEDDSEEYEE